MAEQWQQVQDLFHAALEREPRHRSAFIEHACDGDEALRREVVWLIAAHDTEDHFIDSPACVAASEVLTGHHFEPGELLAHYKIETALGAGGMGEVYLAEDTRLNRKVALKLLPPQFTVNPDRVRRFEREARAVSALNHPNIVTIYEIGKSDTTHFIATEFVDGKTLRQLINEKPLTLNETLNVSMQVADGLSGAHTAGIVHRDIKPENIMIRQDGYVKILDFGLAKLTEQQTMDSDLETPTLLQTNPGLVMGTVQYMSPEQARGKNVGVGTDIWSLGIVMYELLAGHVPFTGETPSHVMVSLMEDKLPPLKDHANIPDELELIVTKALRKNQRERYQTASRMARDVKTLKGKFQREERFHGFLEAVPSSKERMAERSGPATSREALTGEIGVVHATSASGYVSRIKTYRKIWALGFAGFVVVLGLALGIAKLMRNKRQAPAAASRFQKVELIRLTNNGRVSDAAISPDAKYVAYVADNRGKTSIWLREVDTANNQELVPPADSQYYGVTFSRDNNFVYFISKERNNSVGELHKVSVHGGALIRLIVDVDGPVSFSPDGKQLAFVRGSSTGERALILANADGSEERKLASRKGYDAFSFGGPAWSPDGKSIACGAQYVEANERYSSVVSVDVGDGSLRRITSLKWRGIGRISWLPDGSGLLFNGNELGRSSTSQLWSLSYPDGEANRITRDLQEYDGVSLASDSRTLVSKQSETFSSLWIAPKDDADRAKPILSHKEDGAQNPLYYYRTRFAWTPQGGLIYTSLVNNIPSIWIMTAQGTGNKQLTNDPGGDNFPFMTADGRYIIFVSDRSGFTNVWRMDTDGSNPTRLTNGEDDSWAWAAPDGKSLVYHRGIQGRRTLWKVSIDGGEPEQLTDYPSLGPVISPDGRWISCYYRPETKAPWKLAIVPINGGPPVKTFDIPPNVAFQSLVQWTRDGRSLAYIQNRDGIANIWTQPVDGGPVKQLTNFKSDQIFWFDWSPDGEQLGVSRGYVTSDVVLVKDLTP